MIGGDGSAGERCPLVVRVLLIDEDLSSLDSLDKMLRKCDYKVSKSGSLQEGFDLLKERKDGFDIVICDADASDSFNFVHHVSREMDIPVMMMSSGKDSSKVIKGVQHGACFYIQKPIKIKELRMIYQHVVRAKGRPNEIQVKGNGGAEDSDFSNTSSNSRKRKEIDNGDTSTSSKKSRVVWTPYLHQKFVEVVNKIGLEKGGPKRILNMMGVEGLTRENVASHLQKYRLSLSRATQKQNDINPTSKPMPTPTPTPAGHPPVHLSYQSLSDQVALFGQPKIESYGAATLPTLVHPENDSNSLGMAYDHSLFLDADTLGVSMPYLSCSTFENSVSSSYGLPSPSTSYCNNAAVFYSHGQVPSHLTNSIVEYGAAACNSDQSMFTHLRQCELLLSKHGVDLDSFSCNTEQDGDLSKLY